MNRPDCARVTVQRGHVIRSAGPQPAGWKQSRKGGGGLDGGEGSEGEKAIMGRQKSSEKVLRKCRDGGYKRLGKEKEEEVKPERTEPGSGRGREEEG